MGLNRSDNYTVGQRVQYTQGVLFSLTAASSVVTPSTCNVGGGKVEERLRAEARTW